MIIIILRSLIDTDIIIIIQYLSLSCIVSCTAVFPHLFAATRNIQIIKVNTIFKSSTLFSILHQFRPKAIPKPPLRQSNSPIHQSQSTTKRQHANHPHIHSKTCTYPSKRQIYHNTNPTVQKQPSFKFECMYPSSLPSSNPNAKSIICIMPTSNFQGLESL